MRIDQPIRDIEGRQELDDAADALQPFADAIPKGKVRDFLHGVPLGHPLHPLLVQLPIGAWLSAGILDLLGEERAAAVLVNTGLLAYLPAAAAGLADWSKQNTPQRRVGVVHAGANATALVCYSASSVARAAGRHRAGRMFGVAGLAAVSAGGMLGGHLAYALSAGADHAESVRDRAPDEWRPLGPADDFAENTPERADLDGSPVVVVRSGGDVHVLADICAHMGGPLSEGETADGAITCPWHGSTFRLDDGEVVTGPCAVAQPSLEARIEAGIVQARAAAR